MVAERSENEFSYCRSCEMDRPARAHHCRKCKKCVLKMDHHCLWIDNCVGFYTQAHFTRMLFYGFLSLVLTILVMIVRLAAEMEDKIVSTFKMIVCAVNLVFLIPLTLLTSMMLYNQLRLVFLNLTTIEDKEHEDDRFMGVRFVNPYDKGHLANYEQVMGPWYLSWLPLKSQSKLFA
ncbi:DHHC palmitoyltransferase-domain-containing protein [Gorgonomyces haynaldii]|nr:DHHC palmitoyltransferase-domain-containing protein [Gorgonomyces haynaldii]